MFKTGLRNRFFGAVDPSEVRPLMAAEKDAPSPYVTPNKDDAVLDVIAIIRSNVATAEASIAEALAKGKHKPKLTAMAAEWKLEIAGVERDVAALKIPTTLTYNEAVAEIDRLKDIAAAQARSKASVPGKASSVA